MGYTRCQKLTQRDLVNDMSRPHTLVEFRLAEFQLAKALLVLSKKKDQPDYVLDIEFHTQLKELMLEFDFTVKEVISILLAREKFSSQQLNPLLDLIPTLSDEQPLSDGCLSSTVRELIEPGIRPRSRESTPA